MIRFLFFTFFILSSIIGFGQDRPKVGLALSGGGAKGIAHVGIIKVLEEANIKIDYISGTSMGAIIGGLYAAGWSSDQLDSIVRVEDLSSYMVDAFPRSTRPHFDKEYGEKYAIAFSVDGKKIQLPSAVSSGQLLSNFFNRLTRHVSHIDDFDDLPIPFVAFGTDVETGESIAFESGDLGRSMRASGAFPGLLTPFEIDNKLITDGGITNNFPAKILKDKGMDYVIGSNVESGLYTKEDLLTITNIIEQISSFQIVKSSKAQRKYCDLIIRPEIEEFGVTDFNKADTLLKLGTAAAMAKWDSLKLFSTDNFIVKNKALKRDQTDSINISKVSIIKNPAFTDERILDFFKSSLPSKISEEDFYNGINSIFGSHTQRYVDYYFRKNEGEESFTLMLDPKPKNGYDRELRLGVHFDNAYQSSLLINGTILNLLSNNSITSVNLIIGDKVRYTANFLAEYSKKPDLGIDSRLDLNTIPIEVPILLPGDTMTQKATFDFDYLDWSHDIYARFYSDNNHSVGLSGEIKFYNASTDQLSLPTETRGIGENGIYFTGSIFSRYDSRDQRDFAKKGFYSYAQLRYIHPLTSDFYENPSSIHSYNLDWSFLKIFKIANNFSIGWGGNVGLTSEDATPPYIYFVGGNNQNFINNFKAFEGLVYAQEFDNNLLSTNIYGQLEVFNGHYCKIAINGALLSNSVNNFSTDRHIRSFSGSYGIDTPIGPVELTGAFSNKGNQFYFNLGHWF